MSTVLIQLLTARGCENERGTAQWTSQLHCRAAAKRTWSSADIEFSLLAGLLSAHAAGWRFCLLAPLLFVTPTAGDVSAELLAALERGEHLVKGRAAMAVLPAGMVTGDSGICGSEPCWLGKNGRRSLDLRGADDTVAIYSQDSYAAALVSGACRHPNYNGQRGDLIDERILRVIRLLASDAFFFAVERQQHYEVVASPNALAPATLPSAHKAGELVIIWRRVGLSLLLHRVDLDLCPTWETCELGVPSFPGVQSSAWDAARQKALGHNTLDVLSARFRSTATAQQQPPNDASTGHRTLTGDQCVPADLSSTEAAHAASPYPAFPSNADWVLAVSSEFRRRTANDDGWECAIPEGGRRCWRTMEAALRAVDEAERQVSAAMGHPHTLWWCRRLVVEDLRYLRNECPASEKDKELRGRMDDFRELASNGVIPIPGEKPVPATSYAWFTAEHPPPGSCDYTSCCGWPHDERERVIMLYPTMALKGVLARGDYIPGTHHDSYLPDRHFAPMGDLHNRHEPPKAGCERCLELQEHACQSCKYVARQCSISDWMIWRPDPIFVPYSREAQEHIAGACRENTLPACRERLHCLTWSGNVDPK